MSGITDNELTAEEKQFILNVLAQLQVQPAADDAAQTVALVHSIKSKLENAKP